MEINKKSEAQIVSYFHKVITNAAINYYKKKTRVSENELVDDHTLLEIYESKISLFPTVELCGVSLEVNDEQLITILEMLPDREKNFIVQKFVFGKTDKEIGQIFGITRQGITNLKHRLYSKIRRELNGVD